MSLADRLAAASAAFLEQLDPAQRADARLPFEAGERIEWDYRPGQRRGVPLGALRPAQAKAATRLLAELLPVPAYARALTIVGLEEVLDRLEGHRRGRAAGDYWTALFVDGDGDEDPGPARPGRGGRPWGVRFEGHHVSVNATVVAGEVQLTPLFLGANPALVLDAGRPAVAPLGPEEQLGFELLHALTVEQRASAVFADTAPADIVTGNRPRLGGPLPGEGVPLAALTGGAAVAAGALLDVYLGRFPAGARRPDPDRARFGWAGADRPGTGHYYRIAGPALLVELDNTQNGANHVHTVVRDPRDDFGEDLLAAHHRHHHAAPPN